MRSDSFLFASADCIEKFGVERFAEMGAFQVWIGRESSVSIYKKNQGIDLKGLVGRLQEHGIKVILSSIILLDEHTRENVQDDIQEHLDCRPDFSQFSFYSPVAGTPLWDRMKEEGRLINGIPFEEMHAFKQPWFTHPHFTLEQAERLQEDAYLRDYHELGPSIMRWIETDLKGYIAMRGSDSPYLRKRAEHWAEIMKRYRVLLRAIEHLAPTECIQERALEIRRGVEAEFGPLRSYEEAMTLGLLCTGRIREWRTEKFGDDIQPYTRVFHYP